MNKSKNERKRNKDLNREESCKNKKEREYGKIKKRMNELKK